MADESKSLPPLWKCPKCGKTFVTRNMWHSCRVYELEPLFARCEPVVFQLFKKYRSMVEVCGPVTTNVTQGGIGFQARVRCIGCVPRKSYLRCSVSLSRRLESLRFYKIETYSPHFITHRFRVYALEDLDDEVQGWLCESYHQVGQQLRDVNTGP